MPLRILLSPRWSRRGVLLAVAAGVLTCGRAQEIGVAGTMPEDFLPGLRSLLAVALKQSPTMVADELLVAAADAQRGMAGVAPMLPYVAFYPGYGKSVETVSGGGASSGQNGLIYTGTIRQNIFEWGTLKNQLEIQKAVELITAKNYAEGYRNFAASLRRQYLALIVAKVDLRNAQYGLKLSQQALALARDKLQHGTIASSEITGPELDADERQLAVDRATQVYVFARQTLAHQVGLKDIADETIPLEMPRPKYSPEASEYLLAGLMRDGARGNFQAQVAELNIREADLSYKIARVRLLPQFYATAGISQEDNTSATAQTVQQTLVTNKSYYLEVSWTLFDGLATHWAKVQALDNKRYWERQLEVVTDSTMDQAENARHNVEFSWRALGLAERRWNMASGYLVHTRAELRLGNVSQDDVAAATNGLYLSESAIASARADFLSTWSDFVSLVGADPALAQLPAHYVHDLR
jgi:outer membrane protein TolC